MSLLPRTILLLALLAGAGPARAAPACGPPSPAPPLRRAGTATVKITGPHAVQGTFPAICGAYFMMDVPKLAKAGDGLVFNTCIPELGALQVTSQHRKAGRSDDAGIVLNTAAGSFMASAGGGARVEVGADLYSARVTALLGGIRRPKGGKPEELQLEVRFDCPR